MDKFDLPKQAVQLIEEVQGLEQRAEVTRKLIETDLEELRRLGASRQDEIGRRETALSDQQEKLEQAERELQEKREETTNWRKQVEEDSARERKQVEEELARDKATADALITDSLAGFAIVGEAWADYQRALTEAQAKALETKSHPAFGAADTLRAKGKELAEASRKAKTAEWTVALYEWHLPWITELRDRAEQEAYVEARKEGENARTDDPAAHWLSNEEFRALPEGERNQKALDRYLRSRKTRWQLGRDYERYVGYLREHDGYVVTYQGIEKGFEDLGRDVLAERDGGMEVIQCKRWSRKKVIHEKHVFQLYGTMVLARLQNPGQKISGTFTTTTTLSPMAREVAEHLGIKVEETFPLGDYPRIKCNISRRDDERIYHLPFDLQYDTTVIEPERGECYAATVAEAEAHGFRRAWRWRGAQ